MITEVGGVRVKLPHICKKCQAKLAADGSNFHTRITSGKRYYRHLCRPCANRYDLDRHKGTEAYRRGRQRRRIRWRDKGKQVLFNCRTADKKAGRDCDLDQEFVLSLLDKGCFYCGATKEQILMGLDRMDNTVGHLKLNVVPCCYRCNMIRKDMPYAAWTALANGLRSAFQNGLFGNWMPGNCHTRK